MASASKTWRIAVGSRHRRVRLWAERVGWIDGEIMVRMSQTKTPAGEFTRKQARDLCERLRKWWAVVKIEPAH
jgi:hypothetical protein